jgi:hypothetical protein
LFHSIHSKKHEKRKITAKIEVTMIQQFGKLREQFVFRHLDFVFVFKKSKSSAKKTSAKFDKKRTLENLFGKFFQNLIWF